MYKREKERVREIDRKRDTERGREIYCKELTLVTVEVGKSKLCR